MIDIDKAHKIVYSFLFGVTLSCFIFVFISDEGAAPYLVGATAGATLSALLVGITVILLNRLPQVNWQNRLKLGTKYFAKAFLAGILLPSLVVTPLRLNDWAGITYSGYQSSGVQ